MTQNKHYIVKHRHQYKSVSKIYVKEITAYTCLIEFESGIIQRYLIADFNQQYKVIEHI